MAFFTSTVTTFVESGTGISAGGKTGFSSLITTLMFVLSLFLLPVFAFIPKAAAAGALIYVGVLMMKNVVNIDFTSVRGSCTSFFAILMMVLTYSITTGIGVGVITYVAITVVSLIAVALSCMFYFVPMLSNISSGLTICICALIATSIGAIFFPIKEGDPLETVENKE